jgi:hypothetical protein
MRSSEEDHGLSLEPKIPKTLELRRSGEVDDEARLGSLHPLRLESSIGDNTESGGNKNHKEIRHSGDEYQL